MQSRTRINLLWLLVAGFFTHVVCYAFTGWDTGAIAAFLTVFFLVSIAIVHGLGRYSGREVAVYFAIAFVVSNAYENLSILTGFPFGHYHYTENLGPKLFLVPVLIAPAYIGAGFLAWTIGQVLLGCLDRSTRRFDLFAVPAVASFVMVMWDLAMDPKAATIGKGWIWHDGGGYFGVPFVNYLGWLLCVWTIFQIFAWITSKRPDAERSPVTAVSGERPYWAAAIAAYAVLALLQVTGAITQPDVAVTDPSGQAWRTGHIYTSMALIALFTMGFVSMLAMMLIARKPTQHSA